MEPTAATDSPRPSDRTSPLQWAALLAILALAVVLRLLWVGSFEPHFDELWHLEVSTARGTGHSTLPKGVLIEQAPDPTSLKGAPPWTDIWTHMNGNTHPPLYWFALRFWRGLFAGDSLARARSLNAVFSTLSIAALFWVVRALSGTTAALCAALILALSSAQIEAAQEVRNYPLATLCWLIAAAIVVHAARHGRLSWPGAVALGVMTLATLLCLYVAVAAIGATLLYALLCLRGPARYRAAGAILVGGLLFAVLWTPQFLRQREAFAIQRDFDRSVERQFGNHAARTIQRAASMPMRMLFEPRESTRWVSSMAAVLYVLPWFALRRLPGMLLWAISLVATAGLLLILDACLGAQQLDQPRHALLAGPPTAALIAILVTAPNRLLRLVPALVALACAMALGQTYLRQNPQYSDIGRFLSDPATAGEPVVFYSKPEATFWSEWLFVGAAHYSHTFPRPAVLLNAPIKPEVLEQLRAWPHIWVVTGLSDKTPEQIVPGTTVVSVKQNPYLGSVTRLRWTSPTSKPSTGPSR